MCARILSIAISTAFQSSSLMDPPSDIIEILLHLLNLVGGWVAVVAIGWKQVGARLNTARCYRCYKYYRYAMPIILTTVSIKYKHQQILWMLSILEMPSKLTMVVCIQYRRQQMLYILQILGMPSKITMVCIQYKHQQMLRMLQILGIPSILTIHGVYTV